MAQWNEKEVFLAAREMAPSEREEFLRGACPDAEAVAKVLDLLAREQVRLEFHVAESVNAPGAIGPGRRIGAYVLERIVGEGGMGVVYLAHHADLGKKFALKFLAPAFAESEVALAKFRQEARIAASLNHPAIVQVVDLCHDDGLTYIVSEFVDGSPLNELVREEKEARSGDLRTQDVRAWHRRVAQLLATVADALDAAHRNGVIHCDVKPGNILVDRVRGARLSDFGIARHLASEASHEATMRALTPWYASPEQASVAQIDQRSDIFSLGIVLYESLALTRPFNGDDLGNVLEQIRYAEPPRLRSLQRLIPRDLESICLKALEKAPARRYPSAAHIAAELRSFLEGQPIIARPPSTVRRWWTGARRHRLRILVAAVFLLAAGCGWLWWTIHQHNARSLASISIDRYGAPVGAAAVRVLAYDAARRAFIEPRPLGPVPLQARMAPGMYRFVVEDDQGRFVEFDEMLLSGLAVDRRVRLLDEPLRAAEMVRLAAGRHPVYYHDPGVPSDGTPVTLSSELPAFLIDSHEVTNAQYAAFLKDTGYPIEPAYWHHRLYAENASSYADYPVVDLRRADMQAFATWAGKRLPTAEEWLAYAQADDGRTWPWRPAGSSAPDHPLELIPTREAERAQRVTGDDAEVENYLRYARPVGEAPPASRGFAYGNVRELVSTMHYRGNMPVETVVGAMWGDDPSVTPLGLIMDWPCGSRSMQQGFRCARSVAPPAQ